MGLIYSKNSIEENPIASELKNLMTLIKYENDCLKSDKKMEIKNENSSYEYLIFSGGGIKGICYCGALLELEKKGLLFDENNALKFKGIAGTSAGSIIGSLLAIGYTPIEIKDIMYNIDFEKIGYDGTGYFSDTFNLFENWGLCPGNYIQELMGNLIKDKTGNADYTLEDLEKEKNIKLVIVTTNMNLKRSEYLYSGHSNKLFSNIPIRKAIRMSIGIPFMFEPYSYNDCFYVDGGILDNYPLHVFDGVNPEDPKARLNLSVPNPKVLGLKIMTPDRELNYDSVKKENLKTIYEYTFSFIDTVLIENERRLMTPSFWKRSIIIITPDYPLTKFSLTNEEKENLISVGKKYVNEFFDKKNV